MSRLYIFLAILFLNSLWNNLCAQSSRNKVEEGNKLYSEEKYDGAHNKYQDALLDNPNSWEIQYNIGDALYKKKDYEKAVEFYNKALSSEHPLDQSKTYYNIGNTLYRLQKLPESILAYEQALKLNPEDVDAKYNLEFVRNKLKENAQPQPQQQKQQQQQQEQQQEKKKNKEQNQEKNEQNQEQEQQQSQQQPEEKEQKEMSREEAEQLLNALQEDQKDLKKNQMKAQGRAGVAKDW